MLMPRIFGESLFDDLMDFRFPTEEEFFGKRNPLFGKHGKNLMKTDIREKDGSYELDIDLPGFKKDEVKAKLENGFLTISAEKGLNRDQKDNEGRFIRQERYAGAMSRSFYVGDSVKQEDITAKFEDGILRLSVPKQEMKKLENKDQYIAIEG
ncbi:Hsp20/alpha crystallin family protein [Gallibacter intestinalis]|uniref:Hsp20/alpha crystallin family protein n=1 Tax=Gallibacter intestinalis TaxID=2779356 RepID=A0ABR9QV17_9FIRM|nr:Hsp20/alpha crystallin family protein [Gallibacter intestinalis]MBE5034712.1 Hsp20/alpha crystallin family protein [Gallibacter intestinalis]